ncbi:MAG: efflux RND transporter periplasmic adaptor subunit [Saprospirales bacterium]|nr:efflux RND transporter periplasmic adaptor subunit [Saprospirales bacterium]
MLTEKAPAHWIFVDTFLKIGETLKYLKDFARTFRAPYRMTIERFEKRTLGESLKFVEFGVAFSALFAFSNSIVIEGRSVISSMLNLLILLILWSIFLLAFYFIVKFSAKSKNRSYSEFLEMNSWILGFTIPLSYLLLWGHFTVNYSHIKIALKLAFSLSFLAYNIFLIVYIIRTWRYFWGLSVIGVLWRFFLATGITIGLNFGLVSALNTISGGKISYNTFFESKTKQYLAEVWAERLKVPVSIKKVALRSITERVSASGKVAPVEETKIASKVMGTIMELYVKEGDLVEKGQKLLKIGPDMIHAPSSGIVYSLNVQVGQRVVGTDLMDGTELMHLYDENNIGVHVEVGEGDIGRIAIGNEVDIELDAYRDRKFKGQVTRVSSQGIQRFIDGDASVFEVWVGLDKTSLGDLEYRRLEPGMPASVEIVTLAIHNALGVPIISVTSRERND